MLYKSLKDEVLKKQALRKKQAEDLEKRWLREEQNALVSPNGDSFNQNQGYNREMSAFEIGKEIENILELVDAEIISEGVNMPLKLDSNIYKNMKVSLESLASKLKKDKI